jgi:hypothetical protein
VGLLGQGIGPSHDLYLHGATLQRKRGQIIKTCYVNGNARAWNARLKESFIAMFIFMVKFLEGMYFITLDLHI